MLGLLVTQQFDLTSYAMKQEKCELQFSNCVAFGLGSAGKEDIVRESENVIVVPVIIGVDSGGARACTPQ